MELIYEIGNQIGGFLLLGVFALAVWIAVRKSNSANTAEGKVYDLMVKELDRLSKALEVADEQLQKFREDCEAEHIKRDKEILELRRQVQELQTKLLGD